MRIDANHHAIQPTPYLETRGLNMVTLLIWFLTSVVLAGITGLFLRAGARRDTDDASQVEYLSRWSDLKRLRKLG